RGLRTVGARGPAAGRDRRRAGWDAHARAGARGRVRPDRRRPGRGGRTAPAGGAGAGDHRDGDPVSAGGERVGGLARPLLSLLAAALCTAVIVALARTAVGTASGQRLDQLILSGAKNHSGPLSQYAQEAVGSVSLPVIGTLLALAAVLVLIRRRLSLLVPLTVLVLGANLSTQMI